MFVTLDLMISGKPLKAASFWACQLFALSYTAFTIIYLIFLDGTNLENEPYVYPIGDLYGNPSVAIVTLAALHVTLYGFHMMLVYLVKIREMVWSRLYCRRVN